MVSVSTPLKKVRTNDRWDRRSLRYGVEVRTRQRKRARVKRVYSVPQKYRRTQKRPGADLKVGWVGFLIRSCAFFPDSNHPLIRKAHALQANDGMGEPRQRNRKSQVVFVSASAKVTETSYAVDGSTSKLVEKGKIVPPAPSGPLRPLLSPSCALSHFLVLHL